MALCVFFGHRDFDYEPYAEHIESIVRNLIENNNVDEFYSGNRGNFDELCSRIVYKLKCEFRYIQSKLILSYMPKGLSLPTHFDSAKYLLQRKISPRAAIPETHKLMVDSSDFIISGVEHSSGGAYKAVQYALQTGKTIISIF